MNPTEPYFVPYHPMPDVPGRSLLVLAPHPDDEVFGCGGLVALAVSQGHAVRVLVLTDGALGGDRGQRETESRRAADVLGYGRTPGALQFLQRPDRGLQPDAALVAAIQAHAEAVGADVMVAPSPFEVHPDHRAACVAAVAAAQQRQCSLFFYEVGQALMPNRLLDISALVQTKSAAIACFESQLSQQAYGDHILALNRYRAYTLGPNVNHAEAYWWVPPEVVSRGLEGILAVCARGLAERFVSPGEPPQAPATVERGLRPEGDSGSARGVWALLRDWARRVSRALYSMNR